MFDHVGLKVSDLPRSVRFYKSALATLGHELGSEGDGYAGLGPKGAPALWLYAVAGAVGPGTHVAFAAADRAAVARFHAQGLAAGGRDNGGPGLRNDYGANYYAAFLLDPDGHNVEAVCFG
ncbi:MAG TPA: VOC family protein [Burkholderiaceae bacterium]|nr:VOC family protein [Burkholderiaceae bacterium]